MTSKSIQPVDLTNLLPLTAQTTPAAASVEGDRASFSMLLSGQSNDLSGNAAGKPLPATGNNLPELPTQPEGREPSVEVASPGVVLPGVSENLYSVDAQFLTSSLELPGRLVEPESVQQVRVQDIPAASQLPGQSVHTSISTGGESMPTPAHLSFLMDDQHITRVVESPLQPTLQVSLQDPQSTVQQTDQPRQTVAQLPGQVFQAAALVTSIQLQPDIQTLDQPEVVPAQVVQQLVQSLKEATGQQIRSVAPFAGTHIVSQPVSVEMPRVATDLLQKNYEADTDQVQIRAAVNGFPAVETGRVSQNQEPITNIMRAAVQSAVASQAGNGGLQQSLQGHRGLQQGSDITAALTRTEANPLAFLQAVSENSPLTLPSARVQVPVGQQGWGDAVGQQVTWLVSQNISAANLRLNPQHLGPVEMQISMEGDKANISFLSQHTVVREALESSIPRLREMLAESGLDLGSVNISQHGASEQNARNRAGLQQRIDISRMGSGTDETEAGEYVHKPPAVMLGLIDDYA